jgi:hypothetical protein
LKFTHSQAGTVTGPDDQFARELCLKLDDARVGFSL